ncbi:MAG: hypothetical protein NC124_20470 [Clostridium sp.]|nr:hypothetical protein [Clostridium sp.]
MIISNEILSQILECMPLVPPETGGIIGGKNGQICLWEYDAGYPEKGCAYRPDVTFLNKIIEEWVNQGYSFMGIFHVHFGGSKELSDGDKRYIEKIMKAMPPYITQLYFPVVVQQDRRMVSYAACKDMSGDITIRKDEIKVLD